MAQSKPYTLGTARGAKLIILLVDEGTPLLRNILEEEVKKMNPPSLRQQLKKHEGFLRQGKPFEKRRVKKYKVNLNPGQKKKLYPPSGDVPDTAQGFDISLLELLLKELVWLELGRDAPYADHRNSFRQFRNNNYGHIPSTDLSEGDFKNRWKELTEILVDLGGDKDKISERLKTSIDPEREQEQAAEYFALLDCLYKEDMKVKHFLDNLKEGQDSLKEGQGEMKRWIVAGCIWILVVICACGYYFSQPTKSTAADGTFRRDGASLLTHFPRRLKTFVGREDVFSRVDACLQENQTCLIKGLGGVGKTSVAIEYGHRRAESYPGGVFWVRLASKGDMCASISQYGFFLSQRGKESVCNNDLSCESVKCLLNIYLTKSEDWLLVVDEAGRETKKELESLLPHTLKATMHVLLASQEHLRLDIKLIAAIGLPSFNETEAQEMFNKTVRLASSEDDIEDINRLSRSLGHHPLALQFAFAFIEETGYSVKEYHNEYTVGNATEKVDLLDEADIEQFTNRSIQQTFAITFQYVSQLSSNAAKLLDITSFMGPDCIPCPEPNFRKLFDTSSKLNTKKMISVLKKFSLASDCSAFQPCAFSVNRIVQEVVVSQMNESMRLAQLENALKYFTLLLRHRNDTSRVQAELLMAHVHYLALNIGRYQTQVSITGSSSFLNKSAEFFCRWGACFEAYIFLETQILILVGRNSTQKLCYHLRDHVNFLDNTLLPCLENSNVSSELLVYIAENLFWEGVKLGKLQSSYSAANSCNIDHVKTSLESMSTDIYRGLFRELANLSLPHYPTSLLYSVTGYKILDYSHDTIFSPNPGPENWPEFWNPLITFVALAGRQLLLQAQHALRFYVDIIGLEKIEMCAYYCDQATSSYESTESGEELVVCNCNLMKTIRESLHDYRRVAKNATKKVRKVLLMYYRSMDTSTCTNRYYEVMLGLPRESKEFDILEFARRDWNKLIGDPGVVKSVLSQKTNVDKWGRNPHRGAISPLSYLAFHREVRWRYQLATMEHELRQTIADQGTDQSGSYVFPIQNCSVLSDAVAEMEKYRKIDISKLLPLLDSILYLKVKALLDDCLSLQHLKNRMFGFDQLIKLISEELIFFNAKISVMDTLIELVPVSLIDHELISSNAHDGSKRYELSMELIRTKKFRKTLGKTTKKQVRKFSWALSELVKTIGANFFVSPDCMCTNPYLRSVFGCESFFPYTLFFWNFLQVIDKYVDCSLDHSVLNMTCFNNLMFASDQYMGNSISCFFRSKQNLKVHFGQPISDRGETFRYSQKDDRINGLFHN